VFKSDQVSVGATAVQLTASLDVDQDYVLRVNVPPNVQLYVGDGL